MSVYLEVDMIDIRDMKFETLTINDDKLISTFWSFIRGVLTYCKRI